MTRSNNRDAPSQVRGRNIAILRKLYRRQYINLSRATEALKVLQDKGQATGGPLTQQFRIEETIAALEWMFEQIGVSPTPNHHEHPNRP